MSIKEKPVKYTLLNHLGKGRHMQYYNVKEADEFIEKLESMLDSCGEQVAFLNTEFLKQEDKLDAITTLLDFDDKNWNLNTGKRYAQLVHLIYNIEVAMGRE